MRIKKFVDDDMIRLMRQVKEELGPEAVIVSTSQTRDGRCELVAAVETDDIDFTQDQSPEIYSASYSDNFIREKLDFHEVGALTQAQLLSLCRQKAAAENLQDDTEILTLVLQDLFECYDILDIQKPVKAFVGLQGSGKTAALVKTAALARFGNISVSVISADTIRAGANAQLQAFADILDINFYAVRSDEELVEAIKTARNESDLVLIDTPGLNPFTEVEKERLQNLLSVIDGEKILTLDCGYNAYDAGEIGAKFAHVGATCLLPTKLDLCRRMGGLLSAAAEGKLKLGWASVGAGMSNGLMALDMQALAKALLV